MKKRIFLICCACLLALVSVILSACGESEPSEDGAYMTVKDDNGVITGYERKYHNDNGDITRWDVYDSNEQYDHYTLYEYDSDNRLAKETYYRADGIGVYYYAYSYTEDGVLTEKDYVSAKEGSTRTIYDGEGKEKERYTYDDSDNFIKYEEYINDQWVEKELPTETTESEDDQV